MADEMGRTYEWGDEKYLTNFSQEIPRKINHSEDIGLDKKIVLRYALKKYRFRVWNSFNWLRIWTSNALLCKRGNAHFGFLKSLNF
jgi:hypothetical protein